ncbi:MAG: D-tyrosyl-tRNA(Tyr) deacylase [Proteobacteria bacterium]|nr:D-tyrosyl-tRNA(Tyr) deacylase [Pseudomonadota bacterium]NOG60486.1 D-tyrosyl-tRNA(Tyr) deacylase [Pseudomonadota bacterium]
MIGLLQRVTQASVFINSELVASIDTGLLVLIGIEKHDSEKNAERLFKKLIAYRVFADNDDKMNLSLRDIKGDLLLVPQFTLPADTQKGLRPGFSNAASPESGKKLFNYFTNYAREHYSTVKTGVFGADMQVSLVNNGPVTFWLQQ